MYSLQGEVISPGIAIGKAHLTNISEKFEIENLFINPCKVQHNLKLFEDNVSKLLGEYEDYHTNHSSSKEDKEIIQSYIMILKDPEFKKNITTLIKDKYYSAEHAVLKNMNDLSKYFNSLENDYFRERYLDYEDISKALIDKILGIDTHPFSPDSPVIVVKEELYPYDAAKMKEKKIMGVCLVKGSKTSHSAIIARALGIPVVSGLQNIFDYINDSDSVIVDGEAGTVLINPDKKTVRTYNNKLEKQIIMQRHLHTITDLPAETSDKKRIALKTNIELPEDAENVLKFNSDGIGLFRTEFLFLGNEFPSEEKQFEIYTHIAKIIYPKNLTIRTIDLGGDKTSELFDLPKEENPYLGLRGIRLCLKFREVFKTQLRAILRANQFGNIKVMFPMISSLEELLEAKKILNECISDLQKQNNNEIYPIKKGIMIEVPSSVLISGILGEECDFFSIGTNDLTQYTLAVDRNSNTVKQYFDSYHPAVLNMIKITIENGHKNNIPVSICGEMAADLKIVPVLIGLGVDELSVNSKSILQVKDILRKCEFSELEKIAAECVSARSTKEITDIITNLQPNKEL